LGETAGRSIGNVSPSNFCSVEPEKNRGGNPEKKHGNPEKPARAVEQTRAMRDCLDDDSEKEHPAQGAMMPGNPHQTAGEGQRRPASAAIGRCLAGMYDSFLRDPIPERLTLLLEDIDRAGRSGGSRTDQDRLRPSA